MFQLRTRESHQRHCEMVKNDPSLSSAYGVKRESVLNQSRYFNVVDGLDLDIMHDQLEGVLPLETKMLLRKLIQHDHVITLEALNERIAAFTYGPVDKKNKPSPLKQQIFTSDSASISQSAAQMWCLARMLPLLLGDLVQTDEESWDSLLQLLQIEEIVFAPTSTTSLAAYLEVLVKDYLEQFSKIYDRRIIPKQHYMVHYPNQIIRRGPLVHNWAMRFEAKHNYFKRMVDTINNFKNIDFSLARRHQALQAYLLQQTGRSFCSMSLELGPGEATTVADANLEDVLSELDGDINGGTALTVTSWAKVLGTKYCQGCVIVTGLNHGQPTFGELHKVLSIMGMIIFQYKTLHILEYSHHLNAYHVERHHNVQVIKHEHLQDFHPLGIHHGFGQYANKLCVVLRYRVDYML